MADVVERIQQLLDPILASLGLALWDLDFQRQGPQWVLRIYVDRESGVTLNDCESVSRDLSAVLDVEEIIAHSFTLEVSSPGLDRTLSKPEHYVRFISSQIKLKTFQPINGQKVFHGKLLGMELNTIKVEVDAGIVMDIVLSNIAKASLEVVL